MKDTKGTMEHLPVKAAAAQDVAVEHGGILHAQVEYRRRLIALDRSRTCTVALRCTIIHAAETSKQFSRRPCIQILLVSPKLFRTHPSSHHKGCRMRPTTLAQPVHARPLRLLMFFIDVFSACAGLTLVRCPLVCGCAGVLVA